MAALNVGNNHSLENYTSSMIELPPAVDNIYVTNDAINNGSRFNAVNTNSTSQLISLAHINSESQPNSIRRVEEGNNVG